MPPFFSIILPVWNRARILPRAIHSVRTQTWTDWELVIVDDGSTDETGEIARAAARTDSRIISLSQDHSGPARARNTGQTNAHGLWIAFLDSDDYYLPDHLEHRARFLRSYPDTEFLHGGFEVLGDEDRQMVPDAEHPGEMIPISNCVVGATFIARPGLIESVGGWRSGYAEDRDLFQRIMQRYPVATISDPTYIYDRTGTASRCDEHQQESGLSPSGPGNSLSIP